MTNTDTPTNADILVVGGTGTTGRRIAERLAHRGIATRIGSRSGSPRFDWTDRATWPAVLSDVRAAYIAYAPDLAVPGASDDIAALAAAARDSGVDKLVLLSGRGEKEAQEAERELAASGVRFTVLSSNWFMQNFDEGALSEAVRRGAVELPTPPGVGEPFVDADDVADVAVAALLGDEHDGRTYVLSGPESITFEDAVRRISDAVGRPITFEAIDSDRFATMLRVAGTPDGEVELMTYLFSEVLDGRNSEPATGVRDAIGREPRGFDDWAAAMAARGGFGD